MEYIEDGVAKEKPVNESINTSKINNSGVTRDNIFRFIKFQQENTAIFQRIKKSLDVIAHLRLLWAQNTNICRKNAVSDLKNKKKFLSTMEITCKSIKRVVGVYSTQFLLEVNMDIDSAHKSWTGP